jgi:hypothetical protein
MSQATNSTTTIPTRRALLAGAPAAALIAGTGVAALAAATQVDPIFAAIAAHRACIAELCAINDFVRNSSDDAVFPDDLDERTDEANDRRIDAELVLLTTDPTSVAGIIAALEYLGSPAPDTRGRDSFLEYARGWGMPDVPRAARSFPVRMAALLRNIVERGQLCA